MNQSFLFNILIRIILIVLVSFAIGWSFFTGQTLFLSLILIPVLIIQIIQLIYFQNKVNEKISYFFEAIKNEDFSQAFPERKGDKIISELNKNLNEVNQQIQKIKIQNHQQEQYFRALIEHIGTGILTYDENGFVIHANSSLKRILGLAQFTHLKQLEKIDMKLANSLKQIHQQGQKLITFSGKQGKVNVSIKASSFKNNKQNLTLLSIQDINQELDEKELDSWLKLIRVLTHEIMNSIAPVTSLSESLASYFQKNGEVISPKDVNEQIISTTLRGLEIIQEQGKGLISFVESYRKLTRLPKPEKKQIAVAYLLEKIITLNLAELENLGISISGQMKDPELTIMCDEKMISQVMINLIKNAQQALCDTQDASIELIAGVNLNGQTEICVKDNGPGIPLEILEEIFIPFFTTRENGSGIGLSLSRQIMRLHGGGLTVRSFPGKETLFCLRF